MNRKERLILKSENYHASMVAKAFNLLAEFKGAPVFDINRWKGVKASPYLYALDLKISDYKKNFGIPGKISNPSTNKLIEGDLMECIKQDLDFLGYSYRENASVLEPGEWRIAVHSTSLNPRKMSELKFYRQDTKGYWSIKNRWSPFESPTKYVDINNVSFGIDSMPIRFKRILIIKKSVSRE